MPELPCALDEYLLSVLPIGKHCTQCEEIMKKPVSLLTVGKPCERVEDSDTGTERLGRDAIFHFGIIRNSMSNITAHLSVNVDVEDAFGKFSI